MQSSKQFAQRIREVILDGKWVANTNYKALLTDLPREKALQRVQGLNSIAALTFHVNYYLEGLVHFFEQGKLEIRDKYSFDLPEIHTEEAWQGLQETLWANTQKFAEHVEKMSDEQLKEVFVDPKYGDYQRNINGTIEHCYYHLGQISLIKKLLDAPAT